MRYSFHTHQILPYLLALASVIVSEHAIAANGDVPIASANQVLSSLSNAVDPPRFANAAREYGSIIDEVREGNLTLAELDQMREITTKLYERTQAKLRNIEEQAGESEFALERIYRSRVWDDLSFALAAFPYWRAWLDLEAAKKIDHAGERKQRILWAQKGFRSVSMQIFRPGLVFGGWLGLGYVALQQGLDDRALSIFESLQNVLKQSPDNPIMEVVTVELRLLQAKRGVISPILVTTGKLTDQEAAILRAEAYALLAHHRASKSGARGAADRLRRLLNSSHISNSLIRYLIEYHEELVAEDLGRWGDLVRAEYAFLYGHYFDATKKYERFFRSGPIPPKLKMGRFRYHQALAYYRGDIFHRAASVLSQLIQQGNLDSDLQRNTTKLAYAVQAKQFNISRSKQNRKNLVSSARRFVDANPNDPDVDTARLAIAQNAGSTAAALKALKKIKSPSALKGGVERTAFFLIAQEFSAALIKSKSPNLNSLARQGIKASSKLPAKERNETNARALIIQMRALVDPNPQEVLAAIEAMEEGNPRGQEVKRALLWSRLRLFDRTDGQDAVFKYIEKLAATKVEGWQLEQIYPWIHNANDAELRIRSAKLLLPSVDGVPSMDRRFRIMLGEALLETGRAEETYELAKKLVKAHPNSGDGWTLLAKGADQTNRIFEADTAWKVISDRATPNLNIWWESMFSRVTIRAKSTRPEAACELLLKIESFAQYMPAEHNSRYDDAKNAVDCGTTSG